MFRFLLTWWSLAVVVPLVLVATAWFVGELVQTEARQRAAEAAELPIERVEMIDGLQVRLVGFDNLADIRDAVAAVDELESSWQVTGHLGGGGDPSTRATEEERLVRP